MSTRARPLSQAELQSMGIFSAVKADPALMRQEARRVVKSKTLAGEVAAPAFELNDTFWYQSYFDDALQEKALFRQNPNEQIVKSTLHEDSTVSGYGAALHPSSESPVAVQFLTGGQQGASQTYHLKPGQLVRPQGAGFENGQFSGIRWGLPFGWLGGGAVSLVLLRSHDARVEWASDHVELAYHRIRLLIQDPAMVSVNAGAYNGPLNWPHRFPWPAAVFGTSSLTQRGQPALVVQPTRTAFSLRVAALVNPADVRLNWVGADVWAQGAPDSQGNTTTSLADVRATDITWGSWAQQAGAVAPFNSAFPTLLLTGEAERYAANAGALVPTSTDANLQNQYMDIVRYGRL